MDKPTSTTSRPCPSTASRRTLSRYQGKVLLIVNTASTCGFTPQFAGLEELWQTLPRPGPGRASASRATSSARRTRAANDEIASFCQLNYGVTFPMMGKVDVNGDQRAPLWKWLTAEAPGCSARKAIKWNFTKFLVGRDGKVIKRFAPNDPPEALKQGHRGRAGGLSDARRLRRRSLPTWRHGCATPRTPCERGNGSGMTPLASGADALARLFRYFADHECRDDPLYVALCRLIAARPLLLDLLQHAPAVQRVPNLLLAALHDRVLAGPPQAFSQYFPSVGGARAPDAVLAGVFDDFVAAQTGELMALLSSRHTQTNEIGRCAVLWPALCALAARAGSGAWRCWTSAAVPASTWASTAIASTMAPSRSVRLRLACRPSCATRSARTAALHDSERTAPLLVARAGVDPAAVDVFDRHPGAMARAPAFGPTTASAPHA